MDVTKVREVEDVLLEEHVVGSDVHPPVCGCKPRIRCPLEPVRRRYCIDPRGITEMSDERPLLDDRKGLMHRACGGDFIEGTRTQAPSGPKVKP